MAIHGGNIPSRSSGRAMGFVKELGSKAGEHFLHVARHGYGDSGAGGVEDDVHAEVLVAVGANGNFIVVESQCFFQVIDVGLGSISHAEVVDDQAEDDISSAVSEKARGVRTLPVAVASEVLNEADLRQASSLRKPVHAAPDFEVYEAGVFQAVEMISFHNFVGDHFGADADVFVT